MTSRQEKKDDRCFNRRKGTGDDAALRGPDFLVNRAKMDDDAGFVLRWLAKMNDKKDTCQKINLENSKLCPELKQLTDGDHQRRMDRVFSAQSCGQEHKYSKKKTKLNVSSDSSLIEELVRPDHGYYSEKIETKSHRVSLDNISLAQESSVDLEIPSLLCDQKASTLRPHPKEVFEKRLRYKKREYQCDKFRDYRDISKPKVKKILKKRKSIQKSKFRVPEKLIQNSTCKNIGPNRLTICPSFRRGIFNNLKASSPADRRGIPDLYFSNMEFIKNSNQVSQTTEGEYPVNNEFRKEEKCGSISAFSKSRTNSRGVPDSFQSELLVRTRQISSAGKDSDSQKISSKTPDFSKQGYSRSSSFPLSHFSSAQPPSPMKISKGKMAISHLCQSELGKETPGQKIKFTKELFQDKIDVRNESIQLELETPNLQKNFDENQPNTPRSDAKTLGTRSPLKKALDAPVKCENVGPALPKVFNNHGKSPQHAKKLSDIWTPISRNDHSPQIVHNNTLGNHSAPNGLQMVSDSGIIVSGHACHQNNPFAILDSMSTSNFEKRAKEIQNIKRPATTLPVMKAVPTQRPSQDLCSSESGPHKKAFDSPRSERFEIFENAHEIGLSHPMNRPCKVGTRPQNGDHKFLYNEISLPNSLDSNQNADTVITSDGQVLSGESSWQSTSGMAVNCQQRRDPTSFMDPETIWSKDIRFGLNTSSPFPWTRQLASPVLVKAIRQEQNRDESYHFLSQVEHIPDISVNALPDRVPNLFENSEFDLARNLLLAEDEFPAAQTKDIDQNEGHSDQVLGQSFHDQNYASFCIKGELLESLQPHMSYQGKNLEDLKFSDEAFAHKINPMITSSAFTGSNDKCNSNFIYDGITHGDLLCVPKTPEMNNLKDFWCTHRHY